MNPFVIKSGSNAWVLPVSAMMVLTGLMLAFTMRSFREEPFTRGMTADQRERVESQGLFATREARAQQEQIARLQAEIRQLRERATLTENVLAVRGDEARSLNESLQQLKVFAGLTEVVGPGIVITLRDVSAGEVPIDATIIHDVDVLRVVNELWNAGAEAIAVNGRRVSARTNFRCVGTTILIDSEKIATPITIQAIGDPQTLQGAMTMPGGVLDEIRTSGDPRMVEISVVNSMRLPAYAGPTTSKFLKVPEPAPSQP